MNCVPYQGEACTSPKRDDRYDRSEQEDLKLAIDYIYEFRGKLNKLHPGVLDKVEQMLQHNRRY
jgi:hypothetical protein